MGTGISTTAGQHTFAEIPHTEIPRSVFNRSFGHKTTIDASVLYPIFVDEALPGDTMSMDATVFGRFATLIFPLMDNVYLDVHFFAVPNRILWENWERFLGAQDDPGDSTDFLVPQVIKSTGWLPKSIGDYMGLPVNQLNTGANALPFRAYAKIFNDWYRDQNLVPSMVEHRDDGPDDPTDYFLKRRGKRHDYFTSCLPFTQKGPQVLLPLGTTAPVIGSGDLIPTFDVGNTATSLYGAAGATNTEWNPSVGAVGTQFAEWLDPKLQTDLANATAATINEIREAFQIQRLYERDARGGTRLVEVLATHFGIKNYPDARLQRAEYLGGGTAMLNVHSVPVTAPAVGAGSKGPADLGAYGTVSNNRIRWAKSFVEHSVIIGIVSARADLTYSQGLERHWQRREKFDYYWPALSHLGEQTVTRGELVYGSDDAVNQEAFGYQERYAEYRYKPSMITGDFRPDGGAEPGYSSWHLSQFLGTAPALSQAFIEESVPTGRVKAVTTDPDFLLDMHFSYRCARPMPTYAVPGLVDHF